MLKLTLKIKIFLGYLGRNVILTKDNLSKGRWKGNMKCSFCDQIESIQHLFFDCYLARNIWRINSFALHIERPFSINHLTRNWYANEGTTQTKDS
jgi:hypothetical protein